MCRHLLNKYSQCALSGHTLKISVSSQFCKIFVSVALYVISYTLKIYTKE